MAKINDLIEWDYLGSKYSVYIKHFADEDGRKGMTMLFEDVTHEKITEMVIPPRAYTRFLEVVNGPQRRYQELPPHT